MAFWNTQGLTAGGHPGFRADGGAKTARIARPRDAITALGRRGRSIWR